MATKPANPHTDDRNVETSRPRSAPVADRGISDSYKLHRVLDLVGADILNGRLPIQTARVFNGTAHNIMRGALLQERYGRRIIFYDDRQV